MPRRRMIDPEIWRNEKVGSLPDAGRLLFIGIFSQADDDGRLKASPRFLMASIFPYDKDKTEEEIQKLRNQCAELGLIRVYSNSKEEYLDIPGWREHQQIRKDRYNASILPSFDESKEIMATSRQPDDDQPTTVGRHSIVKSSLVKSKRILPTVISADAALAKEAELAKEIKAEGNRVLSTKVSGAVEAPPLSREARSEGNRVQPEPGAVDAPPLSKEATVKREQSKPKQAEAGIFLDMVEREMDTKLVQRLKLHALIRPLLVKFPEATPESLLECFKWLKENDSYCRARDSPMIISLLPSKYPEWAAGKLSAAGEEEQRGRPGEHRQHTKRDANPPKWEETSAEPDDTS